jgi:hypothetical protein
VQVGDVLEQRQEWNRPEDVKDSQMMFPAMNTPYYIPLGEAPSDLAGQIAAALCAGALALNQYNSIDKSTTFLFVRARTAAAVCC